MFQKWVKLFWGNYKRQINGTLAHHLCWLLFLVFQTIYKVVIGVIENERKAEVAVEDWGGRGKNARHAD